MMCFSRKILRTFQKKKKLILPGLRHFASSSGYSGLNSYQPPTLDEMPVPQGPWKAHYRQENKKSTNYLIFGVSFFSFTVYFLTHSDRIFFNTFPPSLDEDEDCSSQEKAKQKDKAC